MHAPETLLIGCVDARLPIQDIGISYGKALIYRNIAALVGEAGGHLSEAAALEFAVNVMRVRDIVVMGIPIAAVSGRACTASKARRRSTSANMCPHCKAFANS